MECRKLEIILVSADDLPNIRIFGQMKVYAEISLNGKSETSKRTTVDLAGETNPKWNFPLDYTVNEASLQRPGLELVVKLFCQRTLGDRYIGEHYKKTRVYRRKLPAALLPSVPNGGTAAAFQATRTFEITGQLPTANPPPLTSDGVAAVLRKTDPPTPRRFCCCLLLPPADHRRRTPPPTAAVPSRPFDDFVSPLSSRHPPETTTASCLPLEVCWDLGGDLALMRQKLQQIHLMGLGRIFLGLPRLPMLLVVHGLEGLGAPTAAAIREREVKAPDGRTVFQRHPETGVLLEPTGLSKACTCTFKMFENPGGYTWKLTPPAMKDKFFDELQKEFTWQPDDEHDVRIMWETKARKRYSDMMSDYKTTLKQCISQGREMSRPVWMTPDFWTGLRDYWHQPEVEAVSTRARANRMSEPDGEGTGISRHVGGSQSTRILQQYMSLDPGTPQDAPNYATFLRLHTYADGSYTSERDARIDAEVHRLAAATGRQERLDEVYLEVVQIDRSRIYGVGSAGQSQASRGSIRSTGTSAVSQQLYETRISTLEERLAAEQAQRQQIEERMAAEQAERQQMQDRVAQLEAFMMMYKAPPPPHPDADDDDDDDA